MPTPATHGALEAVARDGPDAVLVAGSGLIIRLRKDTVGSNPTRPTILSFHVFRSVLHESLKAELRAPFTRLPVLSASVEIC